MPSEVEELTRERLVTLAIELERYRGTTARWHELADRRTRSRALVALQYDRRPDDAPLLRHLFETEIRSRQAQDSDGLDLLDLAAFLLARWRDPMDRELFARAKLADFDAYCGFDHQYVGAEEGDDLAAWWAAKEAWYPPRWQDESSDALVALAIDWDDRQWASTLLGASERTMARDAKALGGLALQRSLIGEHDAAVAALREAAGLTTEPFARASVAQRICELLLEAGRPEEAARGFVEAAARTAAVADAHTIGLGRHLVERGFAIAEALPLGEAGAALVRRSDALAGKLTWRPLVLLQRGAAAALHQGLHDLAARYATDAERERRRIERPR